MILSQTFSLPDIPRVITLAFLEIALSADNAIVLGLLAKHLAPALRQRAFLIGFGSAIVLRAITLLFANVILSYAWLQVLGALYLFYLAVRHFTGPGQRVGEGGEASFWKTVILIELFDLAFAVDSIVSGIAFISSIPSPAPIHPKIWIVYTGSILGLAFVRTAAKLMTQWIDRFPRLETAAYLMIGWIGVKMGLNGISPVWSLPFPFEPLFWTVLILLFLYGLKRDD